MSKSTGKRPHKIREKARKYNTDVVREIVESKGLTLNSEYIAYNKNINVTCPNGHTFDTRFDHFKRSTRPCVQCQYDRIRTPYPKVKAAFDALGYTLLTTDYKSDRYQDLDYICDKGHHNKIKFKNLTSGHRCTECVGGIRLSYEYVKEFFADRGCILLTETYENERQPLEYICSKGHRNTTYFHCFSRTRGCTRCYPDSCFQPDKPASLYYIRFDTVVGTLYKIGITNFSPEERFRSEPTPFKVLKEDRLLLGSLAYEKEQAILKKHKKWKYKGPDILVSGNTELFTKDVLKLDVP